MSSEKELPVSEDGLQFELGILRGKAETIRDNMIMGSKEALLKLNEWIKDFDELAKKYFYGIEKEMKDSDGKTNQG